MPHLLTIFTQFEHQGPGTGGDPSGGPEATALIAQFRRQNRLTDGPVKHNGTRNVG